MKRIVLSALVLTGLVSPVRALVYVESVNGDLSGNANAPTPLVFSLGSNTITGVMGTNGFPQPIDRDIFTVTIPVGQEISAINLLDWGFSQSFYAVQSGTSISLTDSSLHLSNTLINGANPDILDLLVNSPFSGGTGLERPIGAGTYTFWLQETLGVVPYSMEYVVTVVPEPGAAGLLVAPMAMMLRRRR